MKLIPKIGTGTRAFAVAASFTLAPSAFAANDALLELFKILRDKGSLSSDEYELLVNAAKADEEHTARAKQESAQDVEQKVAAVEARTEKSGWTEKVILKGDLRTRYQYQDEDGSADRGRGRIRYRLGVIANPVDNWEVGAGLASGGDDQRSTNQSFDETFSTKGINLDYAYMQYDFTNGFKAIAGKFPRRNYLWAPTDVMWDSDINPEGLSVNYSGMNAWGGFFGNTGVWVLEEEARSSQDPFMVYGQLGQTWSSGDWTGTVAGTVYSFSNIDFIGDITKAEGTNTGSNLGSFNLAADVGTGFGPGRISLLGEYINNFETDSSQDTAWAAGTEYTLDRWAFRYLYADVEANSVPDFLPDSDRFDGLTGIRGHEFEITYALMKNVELGLDFYAVETIAGDIDQEVLQADLNVKF